MISESRNISNQIRSTCTGFRNSQLSISIDNLIDSLNAIFNFPALPREPKHSPSIHNIQVNSEKSKKGKGGSTEPVAPQPSAPTPVDNSVNNTTNNQSNLQ